MSWGLVLNWIVDHISIPPILFGVYKAVRFFTLLETQWIDTQKKLNDVHITSKIVAENHLPHMQETLSEINRNISGLRDDVRYSNIRKG